MTSLGATSLPGKRTHLLPSQSASCELTSTSIVWYRDFDLRLRDHQPLTQASRRGCVIPVFIWPSKRGPLAPGGAAQAWLEESLESLDKSLRDIGSRLILRGGAGHVTPDKPTSEELAGDAVSHLISLVEQSGATHVFYHRAYTPDGSLEQDFVNKALTSQGVQCVACAGHLLYEPSAVDMDAGYSGGHWGTLMPFLRACERSGLPPALPLPPPPSLRPPSQWPQSVPLSCLGLATAPVKPSGGDGQHWSKKIMSHWRVGEAAALEMMEEFVSGRGLARYEFDRSCADKRGTVSSLSPYLRFGQLSVRQLYHSVRAVGLDRELTKTFSRRLHWRDLAYYQLACFPHMSTTPIRAHYSSHRWSADPLLLKAWQRGKTGYPMVDAGMRCLWATGWIHQSVRMVTASFLVEYLGVSWVEGARWYHDTLVDADVAINAMMWQNAGRSGIDQWNFVLSPETASQDATGEFCRKWLPEIARLPNKFLHTPWKAPLDVLARAGVELGATYPRRIISDLAAARRITVEWLLDARRAALHMNDSGGYDVIALPSGRTTRVFTKEEFRLGADGLVKPPQKGKSRAKPPVKMSKSAKQMAEEQGGVAAGSCIVGNSADGGEQELTEVASQSRLTDYFGKGTARRRKIR